MDTRYSPVRRSPSTPASWNNAAPRLACVKPVASVHPEPGSNSTLYNLYIVLCTFALTAGRLSVFSGIQRIQSFYPDAPPEASASCTATLFYLNHSKNSRKGAHPSDPGTQPGLFRKASAKVDTFRRSAKFYTDFFQNNCTFSARVDKCQGITNGYTLLYI